MVATTIGVPRFLDGFKNQTEQDYKVVIAGDNKSPHEEIEQYILSTGLVPKVEYWTPLTQNVWLESNFGKKEFDSVLPWNSTRRRNFAILRALEIGSPVILAMDDDNFPLRKTFLTEHLLSNGQFPSVGSTNGVLNHLKALDLGAQVYPRGFPLSKTVHDDWYDSGTVTGKPVMNMGLWTSKPDVDCWTNMMHPGLFSLGFRTGSARSYVPDRYTYISVDTQNTSFSRELAPAFNSFFLDACRNDDIWGGVFVQRLMKEFGDFLTFGVPLADHVRNPHDYVKDMAVEYPYLQLNDRVWKNVMEMRINSGSYCEGILEIVSKFKDGDRMAFHRWVEMCGKFL